MFSGQAKAFAVGFESWKKPILRLYVHGTKLRFVRPQSRILQRLLVSPGSLPFPVTDTHPTPPLLRWGYRADSIARCWSGPVAQVEDGFIRSVGLGGDLHRPLSWVIDSQGIYYDATRPSDLETWLASADPSPADLARAAALRHRLVDESITKYNLTANSWQRPPGLSRVVLVPGQVESDASLFYGAVDIRTNLELLQAVRRAEPNSYLIYKPHPDVVAGLRRASDAERRAVELADLVLRDASIEQLYSQVDAVHVLTSLAGFEALLRRVEVHTWGLPFYAGWGLTRDAHTSLRRGRRLCLDTLVYGALIAYPYYLSRISGLLITPEQATDELMAWRQQVRIGFSFRRSLFIPLLRFWARFRRRS